MSRQPFERPSSRRGALGPTLAVVAEVIGVAKGAASHVADQSTDSAWRGQALLNFAAIVMVSTSIARCTIHLERPAFARCMSCAKMLCQECATQWEGIWHCAACLAVRRGKTVARSPLGSWISVVAVSLILLYLGARVMVWAGALIAGLF